MSCADGTALICGAVRSSSIAGRTERLRNDDVEPIVIDRSPPERVSDHELRLWASEQKVFVSSVMRDMEAEREAVAAAVEAIGATPVLFERFGGRDDPAEVAYLDGVRGSDIYVGILGSKAK